MIRRNRNGEQTYRRGRNGESPIKTYEQKIEAAKEGLKKRRTRPTSRINDSFHKFARIASEIVGSPWSFLLSIALIVGWAICGPMFGFSDTWQLVINTSTTIVTFLMVFLIQNTQNRDARAIHLKLDELLHAVKGARNRLIHLEEFSEQELDRLQKEFERVRRKACSEQGIGPERDDDDAPETIDGEESPKTKSER